MLFKIKEIFLLILLIFLQSCSGGRIGNFLETSFDNLENTEGLNDSFKISNNKKLSTLEKVNKDKEYSKVLKNEENSKNVIKKKKLYSKKISKSKISNNVEVQVKGKSKNVLNKKNVSSQEEKKVKLKKINKDIKSPKKEKNQLKAYKIIFILRDANPKDPIEELSAILRNSKVNFEIEKIELYLDKKNKTIN